MKCCVCGEKIEGRGHNAEPLKKGRCCDKCQCAVVFERHKRRVGNKVKVDTDKLLECFQIIHEWFCGENLFIGNFEFDKEILLTEKESEEATANDLKSVNILIKKIGVDKFTRLMRKYQ